MKKVTLLILLLGLGIATTGCTPGDVSDGSNGVGIGIGMGPNRPWNPNWPNDPPGSWPRDPGYPDDGYPNEPYPDPYPNEPNPWPNEPGTPSEPDRPPRHEPRRPPGSHCDRLGCWDPNKPDFIGMDISLQASNGVSYQVANLKSKYGVSSTVANKIANAFNSVRAQGMNSFKAIGLTDDDFKAMMNRRLPSDESVKAASAKLGLTENQSRNLLTSMMRSFYAQASNVQSPYWKYCQTGGHWKTDRNRSCSKLYWNGCSPKTGAKFCY